MDITQVNLYKGSRLLLTEKNMTELKKSIKESLTAPTDYVKLYTIVFNQKKDLHIIIAQYTLTPKLALVIKDGDNSQTITLSDDDIETYGLSDSTIGKIISKFPTFDFKKLSIPISDIIETETNNTIYSTIDLKNIHLISGNKSVLEAPTMPKLKALIKETVQAPTADKKIYIVSFSQTKGDKPFKFVVAQYTLTPKLSVLLKDSDRAQTITYTNDEIEKYGFDLKLLGKIIKLIQKPDTSFKKMNISITDIMELI